MRNFTSSFQENQPANFLFAEMKIVGNDKNLKEVNPSKISFF